MGVVFLAGVCLPQKPQEQVDDMHDFLTKAFASIQPDWAKIREATGTK